MTNNLQSNRLAQIKSRLAAATPGPWRAVRNNAMGETWFNIGADGDENILSMVDDLNDECLTQKISDAELIANCPADLAWLIERCEKLEDAVNGADSILVCAGFPRADLLDIIACAQKRLSAALESDGRGNGKALD